MSILETVNQESESVYVFPKSEEIIIGKSDLQIQFDKFKAKIRASFSVYDLIIIVSLWAPTISSDFKIMFGISSSSIKAGYIVFSLMITMFLIISKIFNRDRNTSIDSEIMANNILEKCQKINKI